jgi:EAL domain-containing protein (putative c-di-GMP-specific phosphodiesterase class I)
MWNGSFSSGLTGSVVRTILDLARNLEMDTIAEGVETPEQLAHLRTLGCTIAQGYLFSGPVTADAAAGLLGERNPMTVPG